VDIDAQLNHLINNVESAFLSKLLKTVHLETREITEWFKKI